MHILCRVSRGPLHRHWRKWIPPFSLAFHGKFILWMEVHVYRCVGWGNTHFANEGYGRSFTTSWKSWFLPGLHSKLLQRRWRKLLNKRFACWCMQRYSTCTMYCVRYAWAMATWYVYIGPSCSWIQQVKASSLCRCSCSTANSLLLWQSGNQNPGVLVCVGVSLCTCLLRIGVCVCLQACVHACTRVFWVFKALRILSPLDYQ